MHVNALSNYATLYLIVVTVMNVIPAINVRNYEGIRFVGIKTYESYIVNTTIENSGIKILLHLGCSQKFLNIAIGLPKWPGLKYLFLNFSMYWYDWENVGSK